MDPLADIGAFIRARMPLAPVPGIPGIVLHTASPASGLGRVLAGGDAPPYWAFQWAGGTVLARYILDRPGSVAGRRLLDLGAGSGLAAIAAAKAGAAVVTAAETDSNGLAALALNAEANGVRVETIATDLLDGPPPDAVDLVLVSDLFYAGDLARRVIPFLDRCAAAGIAVLVGDPYRRPLPLARLALVATYDVPDMGGRTPVRSGVFSWVAP